MTSKKTKKKVSQDNSFIANVKSFINEMRSDSVSGASLNLANSIIGGGVLFIPYLISVCGLLLGISLLSLSALVTWFFLALLQKAQAHFLKRDKKCVTLEDVALLSYGPVFYWAIKCVNVARVTSSIICYVIIETEMLVSILKNISDHWALSSYPIWGLVLLGIQVPICLLGKMKNFAFVSFFALGVDIFFLFFAFVLYIAGFTSDDWSGDINFVPEFNFSSDNMYQYVEMVSIIGISLYAYSTVALCPIQSEFKKKNLTKVAYSIFFSLLFVFFVNGSIGLTGYASFIDNTQPNIILSYDKGIVAIILRASILVTLIFTYPLINQTLFVSCDGIATALIGIYNKIRYKKKEKIDEVVKVTVDVKKKEKKEKVVNFVKLVIFTFIFAFIAYMFVCFFPYAKSVISFVGSFFFLFIGLLFPTMFYLKTHRIKLWKKVLIIAFASLCFIFLGLAPLTAMALKTFKIVTPTMEVHESFYFR